MANRTKRTYIKTEKFLERLRKTGNITLACKAEGIGRQTAYDWRNDDETFAKAWDEAIEVSADLLEAEAHRRAVTGLRKAKLYKGSIVHWEREYSDTLLIVLLKANRPEKFRERQEMEIKGNVGIEYVNDWRHTNNPPAIPASGTTDSTESS